MAITTIPGGLYVPPPLFTASPAPGFTSALALTTTATYHAWVFRVPKTGTLHSVGFKVGSVTTPQDVRVSFQDVNTANGNPDGTVDQFCDIPLGTLVANTWTVTPGPLTHNGTGGGTKRSVTVGDLLAIVVQFATTTGNIVIQIIAPDSDAFGFPYNVVNGGGPNAPYGNTVSVTYDDGTYAAFEGWAYPWTAFTNTTVNTGTTPDEVGNRFTPWATLQVDGAYGKVSGFGNFQFTLYDSDGTTVLRQTSTATNVLHAGGSTAYQRAYPFTGGPVTLTGGLTYRIVLTSTNATNIGVWNYDVSPAAAFGAVPLGTAYYATERTNAGAWTDTATRRYMLGLRMTGVDTGSSSTGGGSYAFVG